MTFELLGVATGPAHLTSAGESWRVGYPSTSVSGDPIQLTGLMHLPPGEPPVAGWPIVTYAHMTTGGGSRSAPSMATEGHPELRRMQQGDALCNRLLRGGVVVLRPDYEGLGSPGPHPYLLGEPLARSVVDMVTSARAHNPRLSGRWVSSGHSEGAMAAIWAARVQQDLPPDVDLRGVAALAPVTRTDLTIGLSLRSRWTPPGMGVIPPLIALMIQGAALVDPVVAELTQGSGLSARAQELWPDLAAKSLTECARSDSFGGLAPRELLGNGPDGAELRRRLLVVLRDQEVGDLHLRAVPTRIDLAAFDEVAPWPLSKALVRRLRATGADLYTKSWPTHHSGVMQEGQAPRRAADWILQRLHPSVERIET